MDRVKKNLQTIGFGQEIVKVIMFDKKFKNYLRVLVTLGMQA